MTTKTVGEITERIYGNARCRLYYVCTGKDKGSLEYLEYIHNNSDSILSSEKIRVTDEPDAKNLASYYIENKKRLDDLIGKS